MTDKPIIFSAPMVQALLAGRKTQTRRLIKPQPYTVEGVVFTWEGPKSSFLCGPQAIVSNLRDHGAIRYAPGDRLYVREACKPIPDTKPGGYFVPGSPFYGVNWFYRADSSAPLWADGKWRPSIHMPRSASRLTLTVTEVRVQRLQEISEEDAVAEGVERLNGSGPNHFSVWLGDGWFNDPSAQKCFARLWCHIHGPDAWDANPWVVAFSFAVQQGNIDAETTL